MTCIENDLIRYSDRYMLYDSNGEIIFGDRLDSSMAKSVKTESSVSLKAM